MNCFADSRFPNNKFVFGGYEMRKLATLILVAVLALSLLVTPALATPPGFYFEDPNTTNTFTAVEDDGNITYNFKGDGGAWVNIMNPWGTSSHMVLEPGEGWVQSLIVIFEIEGYDGGDEGYRVMGGFGINGWSPSLWALGAEREDTLSWEEVFGEEYYYYIDGDGVYQFVISFRHAMDYFEEHNDWYIKDFLEGIDCLELGIFDPPKDTTLSLTILDLIETHNIWSFENLSRPFGSGRLFADSVSALPAMPAVEPPHVPRTDAEDEEPVDEPGEDPAPEDPAPPETPAPTDPPPTDSPPTDPPAAPPPAAPPASNDDDGSSNWWIWMVICLAVGGFVAVIIVVMKAKKK